MIGRMLDLRQTTLEIKSILKQWADQLILAELQFFTSQVGFGGVTGVNVSSMVSDTK